MEDDAHGEIALLYDEYAAMVYRRCLRFFGPQEAEDVMHEVFLEAMKSFHTFRGESAPSTWLYRVATNRSLKRIHRESRRRALWQDHYAELESPASRASNQEAATMLRQLWHCLPEELVTIGVYRFMDGMSHEEIADVVGVSRRTVGNRLEELEDRARRLAGGP